MGGNWQVSKIGEKIGENNMLFHVYSEAFSKETFNNSGRSLQCESFVAAYGKVFMTEDFVLSGATRQATVSLLLTSREREKITGNLLVLLTFNIKCHQKLIKV